MLGRYVTVSVCVMVFLFIINTIAMVDLGHAVKATILIEQ